MNLANSIAVANPCWIAYTIELSPCTQQLIDMHNEVLATSCPSSSTLNTYISHIHVRRSEIVGWLLETARPWRNQCPQACFPLQTEKIRMSACFRQQRVDAEWQDYCTWYAINLGLLSLNQDFQVLQLQKKSLQKFPEKCAHLCDMNAHAIWEYARKTGGGMIMMHRQNADDAIHMHIYTWVLYMHMNTWLVQMHGHVRATHPRSRFTYSDVHEGMGPVDGRRLHSLPGFRNVTRACHSHPLCTIHWLVNRPLVNRRFAAFLQIDACMHAIPHCALVRVCVYINMRRVASVNLLILCSDAWVQFCASCRVWLGSHVMFLVWYCTLAMNWNSYNQPVKQRWHAACDWLMASGTTTNAREYPSQYLLAFELFRWRGNYRLCVHMSTLTMQSPLSWILAWGLRFSGLGTKRDAPNALCSWGSSSGFSLSWTSSKFALLTPSSLFSSFSARMKTPAARHVMILRVLPRLSTHTRI